MYVSPINYESQIKVNNGINLSDNNMIGFKSKRRFFTINDHHPLEQMDFYNRIIRLLKPKNFIKNLKNIITIEMETYKTPIERIKMEYHDIGTPQKSFEECIKYAVDNGIISKEAAKDIVETRKFNGLKRIPGVNEILETLPKRNNADNIYEVL